MMASRRDFLRSRHGVLNLARIFVFHCGLFTWFWLSPEFLPYWVYLVASPIVCLVHQREISEWIHESAHFNLVPGKKWNDLLANGLVSVLMGTSVSAYRAAHFRHHELEKFFVDGDPDTRLFALKSRKTFLRSVFKDIIGLTALSLYANMVFRGAPKVSGESSTSTSFFLFLAIFHASFLGFLYFIGRLEIYGLYYATMLTLYSFCLSRFRLYGQHLEINADGTCKGEGSAISRTIDAGIADRVFFTSRVMMYHYEHHKYPHLPFRALKSLCRPSENQNQFSRSRWVILRSILKTI